MLHNRSRNRKAISAPKNNKSARFDAIAAEATEKWMTRDTYIHTYIYEMYNALHSRGWLESEARAVARWRSLGRNGREVECF